MKNLNQDYNFTKSLKQYIEENVSSVSLEEGLKLKICDEVKIPVYESLRIGICDEVKIPVYESLRIGICDEVKVPVYESLRIGIDDKPEYETILENIYDIYSSYSNATQFSGTDLSIHTKVKQIINNILGGSFGSLNKRIIVSTMTRIEYEFTKHKCPLELTAEEYYDAYYMSYGKNKKGVNDPAKDLIVNSVVEMEYWDHKQNYICEIFDVTLSSSSVLEVIYHPNNYYSVCVRSLDTDNIWAYIIVKMK